MSILMLLFMVFSTDIIQIQKYSLDVILYLIELLLRILHKLCISIIPYTLWFGFLDIHFKN